MAGNCGSCNKDLAPAAGEVEGEGDADLVVECICCHAIAFLGEIRVAVIAYVCVGKLPF